MKKKKAQIHSFPSLYGSFRYWCERQQQQSRIKKLINVFKEASGSWNTLYVYTTLALYIPMKHLLYGASKEIFRVGRGTGQSDRSFTDIQWQWKKGGSPEAPSSLQNTIYYTRETLSASLHFLPSAAVNQTSSSPLSLIPFSPTQSTFLLTSLFPFPSFVPSNVPSFLSSCGSTSNSPQLLTFRVLKSPFKFPLLIIASDHLCSQLSVLWASHIPHFYCLQLDKNHQQ